MWDEISYQFPNFNGCTIEDWEWISDFILHFTRHVITYFGLILVKGTLCVPLQWRHNGLDGVSNHQPHDYLLSRLFGRRSKKISKLRVTGLCEGNSPGTGEFPAQMTSNAEMSPFDDVIMNKRPVSPLWTTLSTCHLNASYATIGAAFLSVHLRYILVVLFECYYFPARRSVLGFCVSERG